MVCYKKIKENKDLETVIKLLRYDATRQLFGKDSLTSIPKSERAFYEHVGILLGSRSEQLNKILTPLYEKVNDKFLRLDQEILLLVLVLKKIHEKVFKSIRNT